MNINAETSTYCSTKMWDKADLIYSELPWYCANKYDSFSVDIRIIQMSVIRNRKIIENEEWINYYDNYNMV